MRRLLQRLFDRFRGRDDHYKLYMAIVLITIALLIVIGNVITTISPKRLEIEFKADSGDSFQVTEYHSSAEIKKTSRTTKSSPSKPAVTKKTTASKAPKVTEAEIVYSFPADINTADLGCFCAADGIGKELAQRIIAYRDSVGIIYNMDMLSEVEGIGEKKLSSLKEQFYVLSSLKEQFYVSSEDFREMPAAQTEAQTVITEVIPDEEENEPYEEETSETEEPEPEPQMRRVNINTASAEEIAECLLIDIEQANRIVELRELISYFSAPEELILNDTMSKKEIVERLDYIEI